MKTKLILILTVVVCLLNIEKTHAQYITSGGVRIGGTTGFTAKRFFRPGVAVEGIFGTFGNGYSLTGLIEKFQPAFQTPGLYFFYGGGIHFAAYEKHNNYESNFGREINYTAHNNLGAGLNAIAGLEYRVPHLPLAISVELKPFVELGSAGHTGFAPDPSVGVRYIFK